jgi:hypothetical protein
MCPSTTIRRPVVMDGAGFGERALVRDFADTSRPAILRPRPHVLGSLDTLKP